MAVIGAGPVGLTTMMCARLAEPERIIALDVDESRLQRAAEHGLADAAINPAEKSLDTVESLVRTAAHGRGADCVIEAAGGDDTFEMAWRIARPNATVVLSAMYEHGPGATAAPYVRQKPYVQDWRRGRKRPRRGDGAHRGREARHEPSYFAALSAE